ncbi:hypothetical protein AGMMS50268_31090 [Spirochaetia bacterium]|nr:hypothetical protein AGMMS50268_31090 [Spirochaetia bacterium]
MVAAIVVVIMGIVWVYRHFATPISIEKPVDDSGNTACLYIQNNLTMVQFDGRKVRISADFGSRAAAVNVPEGIHTLVFDYEQNILGTTTTARGFELSIPFESG